jgi:hypothetical protein
VCSHGDFVPKFPYKLWKNNMLREMDAVLAPIGPTSARNRRRFYSTLHAGPHGSRGAAPATSARKVDGGHCRAGTEKIPRRARLWTPGGLQLEGRRVRKIYDDAAGNLIAKDARER